MTATGANQVQFNCDQKLLPPDNGTKYILLYQFVCKANATGNNSRIFEFCPRSSSHNNSKDKMPSGRMVLDWWAIDPLKTFLISSITSLLGMGKSTVWASGTLELGELWGIPDDKEGAEQLGGSHGAAQDQGVGTPVAGPPRPWQLYPIDFQLEMTDKFVMHSTPDRRVNHTQLSKLMGIVKYSKAHEINKFNESQGMAGEGIAHAVSGHQGLREEEEERRKVTPPPCRGTLALFHGSAPRGCITCSPLELFGNQMSFAAKLNALLYVRLPTCAIHLARADLQSKGWIRSQQRHTRHQVQCEKVSKVLLPRSTEAALELDLMNDTEEYDFRKLKVLINQCLRLKRRRVGSNAAQSTRSLKQRSSVAEWIYLNSVSLKLWGLLQKCTQPFHSWQLYYPQAAAGSASNAIEMSQEVPGASVDALHIRYEQKPVGQQPFTKSTVVYYSQPYSLNDIQEGGATPVGRKYSDYHQILQEAGYRGFPLAYTHAVFPNSSRSTSPDCVPAPLCGTRLKDRAGPVLLPSQRRDYTTLFDQPGSKPEWFGSFRACNPDITT
ncbi:hypothetical protein EK904_001929 [Melospiza melodia maxima]|nr:hypothetical protein EK904_001929 [Melospiza melodia maxima]